MLTKTLQTMAAGIQRNQQKISEWYQTHAAQAAPPFYSSVDLRDSGHKIVPVDSNLFPAGFNNICPEDLRTAPNILRTQIETVLSQGHSPNGQQILIIPESHTQNANYIENLYYLHQLVENAGYSVRIGWYGDLPDPSATFITLTSTTGKELKAYPIRVENSYLSIDQFIPDLILLNNDFSSGYPRLLDAVAQPILPSHTLGWHSRKKSEHFRYYNQLAAEFAGIIGIDPWTIQIDTEESGPINFNEGVGVEKVAEAVERVLQRTRKAYQDHSIQREPFVFVKNNSGTYGMGILVAHSSQDILQMNRRTKNKMSVGKNRLPIESVVIQEGVPTTTLIDRLVAEPVIYLFGPELIGGFLRTNTEKGDEDNLNSNGMVFKKLCMSDLRKSEEQDEEVNNAPGTKDEPLLELVYGSVARISALATGMELAQHPSPNKDAASKSSLATSQHYNQYRTYP